MKLLVACLAFSCSKLGEYKVPVYGWLGGPGNLADQELKNQIEPPQLTAVAISEIPDSIP